MARHLRVGGVVDDGFDRGPVLKRDFLLVLPLCHEVHPQLRIDFPACLPNPVVDGRRHTLSVMVGDDNEVAQALHVAWRKIT